MCVGGFNPRQSLYVSQRIQILICCLGHNKTQKQKQTIKMRKYGLGKTTSAENENREVLLSTRTDTSLSLHSDSCDSQIDQCPHSLKTYQYFKYSKELKDRSLGSMDTSCASPNVDYFPITAHLAVSYNNNLLTITFLFTKEQHIVLLASLWYQFLYNMLAIMCIYSVCVCM